MTGIRRGLLILVVLVVAAADILVYLNSHLFYQAEKIEKEEGKIGTLTRANRLYPFNDLVYYSLGKAYLDLGLSRLSSSQQGDAYFRTANQNFRRSIKQNPTAPFSHFYFAQSLFNLSLSSDSSDSGFIEGYKRAAELARENSQVFYEVGKAYLSLWPRLSAGDRSYALNLVKKIFEGKNGERIISLIHIWALNVGDFDMLESLLPQDAGIYRLYAGFLGEKAISIEQRQKSLAQAEFLEFERAKTEFQKGESEAFYYQWTEAEKQFNFCLSRLNEIYFYQELVSQKLIDISEYNRLLSSCHLYLAKCRIESGGKFADAEDDLREYLRLEENLSSLNELEKYLIERGFIKQKLSEKFDDLTLLSYQLILFYKQNRYSEIVSFGRLLQRSFVVIPEEKKRDYIGVLHVLGDALQKLNNFYEADDFYQKALEFDPQNVETLVRIRQNYTQVNNENKLQEINRKIKEAISSEVSLKNFTLEKGQEFSQALIFDGQKMILDFSLDEGQGVFPVISVLFNNRIVWERISEGNTISLPVQSRVGENILDIVSLNRPVSLRELAWRYENGE